ncbi:DUF960 domain-containing protein [Streptococcus oricebi]|uniref:GTP cyclohydrolase n=1 Tax=Streptococcus oricebi TaxID=1547447 RepID=A0ABS5B2W4_9STRE|nr:DUF960 domain-containing protein [Streptococcus oricebi]MBP2622841.1 hypothetical protein [Streptococcus oricebi]
MAFTDTKGRYASFGVVTSLPEEVIDAFWYIIDNYLKGVFQLNELIQFELLNKAGQISFRFSEKNLPTTIIFDSPYSFDPFYPRKIYVTDNQGKETIMLADEYSLM